MVFLPYPIANLTYSLSSHTGQHQSQLVTATFCFASLDCLLFAFSATCILVWDALAPSFRETQIGVHRLCLIGKIVKVFKSFTSSNRPPIMNISTDQHNLLTRSAGPFWGCRFASCSQHASLRGSLLVAPDWWVPVGVNSLQLV